MRFLLIFAFVCVLALGIVSRAEAAVVYFLPEKQTFGIGEEFQVDLKVDSEEESINAVQGTVRFPTDILELQSVTKEGTTFGFWLQEPTISNEEGTAMFINGAAKGVNGKALQVAKLNFKAIGAGSAEVTLSDAGVTAADGKGTNVLSRVEGVSLGVGTQVVKPQPVQILSAPPPEELQERPQPVEREATTSDVLPERAKLRVPLYPDQDRWYGHLGETNVFWELPSDIVEISTRLTDIVDDKPGDKTTKLFTGKSFGVLEEGTWFIRVQFRNNVGWGPLEFYKVQIDTTSPAPFEIKTDNRVSDNPTPRIRFETQDGLSGISGAHVLIDGQDPIETTETELQLPVLAPGEHRITVRIFDLAGNSVEDDIVIEVLPLPTPTINFLTQSVAQGDFVFVSGEAISNGFVDVQVTNQRNTEVFRGAAVTDGSGNWEMVIEEGLPSGSYALAARARDERGAVSLATEPHAFRLKAKPVISLGIIELGWLEIFIILVLFIISGVSASAWYYTLLQRKRAAYGEVAARDVVKLSQLLEEDMKEIAAWMQKSKKEGGLKMRALPEIEFHLAAMQKNVGKMKQYLNKELDKMK